MRQAAALQERQIGAGHPDLANTLNNLGIVYEHLGKPPEAEECYRRAYGIASTALPPDHPLVETSG
ncbi:MAG TPA: tetratricopeptide repeat protein, partial [Vicinamibacterales bacterium]